MLLADSLSVTLGSLQFRFSFSVEQSEILAVFGPSGSGKSTLLSLVGGFLHPDSGTLSWQGDSLLQLPPARRPVTSLFQSHNLFEHLTVADNIGLGLDPALKLSIEQKQRLKDVLEQVGLAGFEKRMPRQLSGGEQQRVGLARCLIRKHPILLLDEPYSALDESTRTEMLELTSGIIESEKLCTLLVTHNREDAVALGAKSMEIVDGVLVDEVLRPEQ